MNVKVQLVFNGRPVREITVAVSDKARGNRFMNAIDRAVEAATKDCPDWTRWNLISTSEDTK